MTSIISVRNFSKNYGDFQAVKGISFDVEDGSLFAFLGPNGAGKSTTIEALTTLTKFNGGDVTINGFKLGTQDNGIRRSIGVVFQQGVLDHHLTVYENLWYRGSLYGFKGNELKKRIEAVSDITDIKEFWKKRYAELSGGQMRRVDIARALIHTPKILFLDEPSTGVDPKTRENIWTMIRSLRKDKGMTVFLTTHYMEEASDADKLVIISRGEIIDQGTPAELRKKYTKTHVYLYGVEKTLLDELQAKGYQAQNDTLHIQMEMTEDPLKVLEAYKGRYDKFEVNMGTMDEMFVHLVELGERHHE